ncbi:MAG: homoserine kinase [Candidatus Obscuribacterales bacterium]|nr:homoserine kinase [Candidatus Obscuribacterales bacterium]
MISKLTLRIPASSANLGPGFDTLALAFQLYCTIDCHFLEFDDPAIPLVTLGHDQSEGLPSDKNNLIYNLLSRHWQSDAASLTRLRISVSSDIPTGKGLGSSAAATAGALYAVKTLCEMPVDKHSVLALAAKEEGHADNVAASIYGGLVTACYNENNSYVFAKRTPWPKHWSTIVVVPERTLSTKASRSALPGQVSHRDATTNVQMASLLMSAAATADEDALQYALASDRLHEPYRQKLVPELNSIRHAISNSPCLGTVLSGAGPSVLTIVNKRHKNQVLQSLQEWSKKQSDNYTIMDLSVDQEGLRCDQ